MTSIWSQASEIFAALDAEQSQYYDHKTRSVPGARVQFTRQFLHDSRALFADKFFAADKAAQPAIYRELCSLANAQTCSQNRALWRQILRQGPPAVPCVPEVWAAHEGISAVQEQKLQAYAGLLEAEATAAAVAWQKERATWACAPPDAGTCANRWRLARDAMRYAWDSDHVEVQKNLLEGLPLLLAAQDHCALEVCLSDLFAATRSLQAATQHLPCVLQACTAVQQSFFGATPDAAGQQLLRTAFASLAQHVDATWEVRRQAGAALRALDGGACGQDVTDGQLDREAQVTFTAILADLRQKLACGGPLGRTILERIGEKQELLEASQSSNAELARAWLRQTVRIVCGTHNYSELAVPLPPLDRFVATAPRLGLSQAEVQARMDTFSRRFAAEVIGAEDVYAQLAPQLRRMLCSPTKLTAITFHGPAGSNKTSLAKLVHETIFADYVWSAKNMGGKPSTAVLAGADPVWQGAKCGEVAKALMGRAGRRMCFFFDELARAGQDNQDLLATLLDQGTGPGFEDQYLGFPIDVRGDAFLFASNDFVSLSDHLQSRLYAHLVVQTREMNEGDLHELMRRTWNDTVQAHAGSFVGGQPQDFDAAFALSGRKWVLDGLESKGSTRELKRAVENLCHRYLASTLPTAWRLPLQAEAMGFLRKAPWHQVLAQKEGYFLGEIGFIYHTRAPFVEQRFQLPWPDKENSDAAPATAKQAWSVDRYLPKARNLEKAFAGKVEVQVKSGAITVCSAADFLPTYTSTFHLTLLEPTAAEHICYGSSRFTIPVGSWAGWNASFLQTRYPDAKKSVTDLHPDEQIFRLVVSIERDPWGEAHWQRWVDYCERRHKAGCEGGGVDFETWGTGGYGPLPAEEPAAN